VNPVERARQALLGAGFTVCRPGEALGPCKAKYLVVYDAGLTAKNKALAERVVGLVACVPLGRHEELGPMLREASAHLAEEGLSPRGSAGPEAVDEGFRAHTQAVEFTALCAL